jgi:hypothetical protein
MSKDPGPAGGGTALPKPGQTAQDFVREFAVSTLQPQQNSANLIRTVAKMDAIAEMEIARLKRDPQGKVECKVGCDHCCHRIVGASVSEAIQIATRVSSTFNPAQRKALIDRCREYATATFQLRSGRINLIRSACPLLVDHKCSVYDVRPLGCRGSNSKSVAACEANRRRPEDGIRPPVDERQNVFAITVSDAHALAMHELGLSHYFVDLGLALPELLENPGLIDQFLAGEKILMEQAIFKNGPDPIREQRKKELGGGEPSGFAPSPAIPGHPVYDYLRLSTPTSFSSQEHIDQSLARFRRMIDDFVETPMDPGRAFDGLGYFQTFGLPYTGENVTDLVRMVGEKIVNPVVARALPDLVTPLENRKPKGKLRVGYLSVNYIAHHSTNFTLGWISNHAEDIESYVFHVGKTQDRMSILFRDAADHFYHVPGDVPSTARFIKSLELDVLVFPDIGNYGINFQYAGMRLAPVQCTAWGQPITSGLSTVDYYLSSELMEPENGDEHYTEKLIRLPGSGLHWNPVLPLPSNKTREELGIPDGLVYFMAQNIRKLAPKWDYLFAEIQARTGAPMFFIDFGVEGAIDLTKDRLEKAGVKATWLPRMPQSDFVRMQQLCDVSLDPPAWNGGNTTVYGLSVASPIVTLPGEFMRGRHSIAFMKQANVEGLIAKSPEDYIDLATDPDRLRDAMKDLQWRQMIEDPAVPPAFDAFLRKASGRD